LVRRSTVCNYREEQEQQNGFKTHIYLVVGV
jgi:hypothetical protein